MKISIRKAFGNVFVLVVFFLMMTIYYTFVFVYCLPNIKGKFHAEKKLSPIILYLFHLVVFMLFWSFIQAASSDPGKVPPYWGFYMGDAEYKRKRYCLMCHVFKPERCHHCSVCGICILNMDHHCPWINNCIGFNNRKIFMLMLFYSLVTSYYVLLSLVSQIYDSLLYLLDDSVRVSLYPHLLYIAIFLLLSALAFILTKFTKFHVDLVLNNSTTIECLEKSTVNYSISPLRNWQQVFGKNPWLWPFPIYRQSGRPIGDGVFWPQTQLTENNQHDINVESEVNREGTHANPPIVPSLSASASKKPLDVSSSSQDASFDALNEKNSVLYLRPDRASTPYASEIDTETTMMRAREESSLNISAEPILKSSVLEINLREQNE